ncbi:hypothetical protein [Haloplanus sp. C73]|uniref:hypothetical protein n=1 Tax=Haloplanus sp. C73 TaxID=3421641 RepID=UPI003EC13429
MTGVGVLVLAVALGVGAPLCLYWLVRAERENRTVMDRDAAERVARRDEAGDDRD